MSERKFVLKLGYQHFLMTEDLIQAVLKLKALDQAYHEGSIVYWAGEDVEVSIEMVPATRISDTDPRAKKAPTVDLLEPPTPVAPTDDRLMASISDKPIVVNTVPPLREFVDEFRAEELQS